MGPLDDQVVREDSLTATPDGLDIAIYTHWYRALPLPSLARVDLTVDGEPDRPGRAVGDGQRPPLRLRARWPRRATSTGSPPTRPCCTCRSRPRPAASTGCSCCSACRSPTSSPVRTGCRWWRPVATDKTLTAAGASIMTDTAPGLPRLGTTLFSLSLEQRKPGRDFASLVNEVAARDLGPGLEMVAFQSLRGWPRLSDAQVREVRGVIEASGLTPSCLAINNDLGLYPGRLLTDDESYEYVAVQVRGAAALGFPVTRVGVETVAGDPRAAAAAGRGARREDRRRDPRPADHRGAAGRRAQGAVHPAGHPVAGVHPRHELEHAGGPGRRRRRPPGRRHRAGAHRADQGSCGPRTARPWRSSPSWSAAPPRPARPRRRSATSRCCSRCTGRWTPSGGPTSSRTWCTCTASSTGSSTGHDPSIDWPAVARVLVRAGLRRLHLQRVRGARLQRPVQRLRPDPRPARHAQAACSSRAGRRRCAPMSRVLIIGSGPTGADLRPAADSSRPPDVVVLMVEAGPVVVDPAGHERQEHRRPGRAEPRPAASQGRGEHSRARGAARRHRGGGHGHRPLRHRTSSAGRPRVRRPARRRRVRLRRRPGRALDLRHPAPGGQRADRLPARPRRAARRGVGGCCTSPAAPSATRRRPPPILERVGAEFAADGLTVAPAAGGRRPAARRDAALGRHGRRPRPAGRRGARRPLRAAARDARRPAAAARATASSVPCCATSAPAPRRRCAPTPSWSRRTPSARRSCCGPRASARRRWAAT